MKNQRNCPAILLQAITIFLLIHASEALAQTTTNQEEMFVLSPFVVKADSQIGYMATETLSGSRLRTKIGDLAASVDVLTDELLRDLGAISIYDALDQVGSISTWGKSGGINENENAMWHSTPYMARGFQATSMMSDFFELGKVVPLDFYNQTNVTVARGPNAILFGVGSPGGLVNSSRKRPLFGKNLSELVLRTDNYGSFRSTLDISRELIDGKLAVRAALLHDDRKEFLKPAGYLREGVYGAVTYQPFKTTSITVTAESGKEARTFQYTTTQYDGTSPWMKAGMPVYGGFNNIPPVNEAFGSGLDRESKIAIQVSSQPQIPILNWDRMARTERYEIAGYPSALINNIRSTGYTDATAPWDWENIQLTGDSRRRNIDWKDYAFFFTQQLFVPSLNLELAASRSESKVMTTSSYGQFFLQMDVNSKLPNGAPNPNYLVPYVESGRTEVITDDFVKNTARATLSYVLDLNKHKPFGLGLGRYNFMGLYEKYHAHSLWASFKRAYSSTIAGFPVNDLNNSQNAFRTRTYVKTNITPAGAIVEPYYKEDWTLVDRDGAKDVWYRHTSPRDINDERKSAVAAVQAYLWEAKEGYDRFILTAGYRKDKATSQRKEYISTNGVYQGALWRGDPFNVTPETHSAIWDGTFNYGTWGALAEDNFATKSYSAIFKPTKNIGLFYNYSDVLVQVSSLFADIYGRPVKPTVGETNDFGFRLNLLEDKLVASLTVFETSQKRNTENDIRTMFTPELEDIWAAVDPTQLTHKGFPERFVTLRDETSKGIEFNLTANLTRSWSTRLVVSQIETIVSERLPIVKKYIAEYSPLWEAKRALPLNISDQVQPNYLTVGNALDSLYTDIANIVAQEGTVPNAQREWKVVLNTSYNFSGAFMKGWGIGGGVRWESPDIIGYAFDVASLKDTTRPVVVDPTKPFYGEELLDFNGWLSYSTKIFKHSTRFQLNVNNLFDKGGTFARSAFDDMTGNPWYGRQQVREPRSFTFTTTVRF